MSNEKNKNFVKDLSNNENNVTKQETKSKPFYYGLVFKISTMLTLAIGLIFLATSFVIQKQSIFLLTASTTKQAIQTGDATVNHIDQRFLESMRMAEFLASDISEKRYSDKELKEKLKKSLLLARESNKEILAFVLAFEPEYLGNNEQKATVATYKADGVHLSYGTDYIDKHWYKEPKENGHALWVEPFIGVFVPEPIATYSVPIYEIDKSGQKHHVGVLAIDLSIKWLQDELKQIDIPDEGYSFLLSKSGRIIAHPNKDYVFSETVFSVADIKKNPALNTLGNKMIAGDTNTTILKIPSGNNLFVYYRPMKSTGWSFGIVFPEEKLFSDVDYFKITFLIIGAICMSLFFILIVLIAMGIARPLKLLEKSIFEIENGNLSVQIPVFNRNDEVETLSTAFRDMRDSLIQQMKDLKETTIQKEKIESELKTAHDIQKGILPQISKLPICEYFDLSASLTPAHEVGGDLYDFFMQSPTKLCVAMGDVSGKGVPAALFMAITQTLQRGLSQNPNISPEHLVTTLNKSLCANTNSNLFVTYQFCVIDFENLIMTYTNAGHNPFYVLKQNGELLEKVCDCHGVPLGAFSDCTYPESKIQLEKNDILFFYTDGVTEAQNKEKEFYGAERLKSLLVECVKNNFTAEEIERKVKASISDFAVDTEQFDDIAVLCVKIK